MNGELNVAETPWEDLRANALREYEDVSSKAHSWSSVIPKAINYYFDNYRAAPTPTPSDSEHVKALVDATSPVADYQKVARDTIAAFMREIPEGDEGYSCNECELDCYLCPHVEERLLRHITTALESTAKERDAEIERLRQGLWECAIAVGEDIDDPTPHYMTFPDIVEYALRAVREHRRDYDELLNELPLRGNSDGKLNPDLDIQG